MIEHCIEWAREQFHNKFEARIQDTMECLKDPTVFHKKLKKDNTTSEQRKHLAAIEKLVNMKMSGDITMVVSEARSIYNELVDHNICNLLKLYPAGCKDKLG